MLGNDNQGYTLKEFIAIMILAAAIFTPLYLTNKPPTRPQGEAVLATPRFSAQFGGDELMITKGKDNPDPDVVPIDPPTPTPQSFIGGAKVYLVQGMRWSTDPTGKSDRVQCGDQPCLQQADNWNSGPRVPDPQSQWNGFNSPQVFWSNVSNAASYIWGQITGFFFPGQPVEDF